MVIPQDMQKTLAFALTGFLQSIIDYGKPLLSVIISILTIIVLIQKIDWKNIFKNK